MGWMSPDENVVISRLEQCTRALDVADTGALSWREFIIVAALPSYPSTAELLEMRKAFTAADADADNRVTLEEFKSVKLWFQNNSKLDNAKKEALCALLYPLFTVPDPNQPDNDDVRLFDYLAFLLHCCADKIQTEGVARAFRMVAAGDAPLRKEEVARIA